MNVNPTVSAAPSPVKDIWRVAVAFLTSLAVGVIVHFGFHLTPNGTLLVAVIVGFVLSAVLRFLEAHFPWVGALLGLIGAPNFPPSAKLKAQAYTQSLEAQLAALETRFNEMATPSTPSAPAPTPSAPVSAPPADAPAPSPGATA